MATVRFLPPAQRALLRHRNVAKRILAKIQELAEAPDGQANNVTRLQGRPESRLRVGDFRIIFLRDGDDLLVVDIAPRGSIYD